MELKLTEQEAIELTMEYGFDGSEFDTSKWKQRGCLQLDRTQKGLVEKLKTIYNKVSYEGRGKKRMYTLSDKKEKQSERKFNYKGTVSSDEDEIMKHYVFNQLLKLQSNEPFTYRKWGEKLGFYNTSVLVSNAKVLTELIKDTFKPYVVNSSIKYNSNEILSKFIQQLNDRNLAVLKNSFSRLQKEGKISVSEVALVKFDEAKETEAIDKPEYDKIIKALREHLESEGYTYQHYIRASQSFYKSKRDNKMIASGKKFLGLHFGIEFIYKAFKIEVINTEEYETVSKREFYRAFFMRFITLAKQRQSKDGYKNSIYFWKKFNYFNLLLLLNHITDDFETHFVKVERELPQLIEEYRLIKVAERNETVAFGEFFE